MGAAVVHNQRIIAPPKPHKIRHLFEDGARNWSSQKKKYGRKYIPIGHLIFDTVNRPACDTANQMCSILEMSSS